MTIHENTETITAQIQGWGFLPVPRNNGTFQKDRIRIAFDYGPNREECVVHLFHVDDPWNLTADLDAPPEIFLGAVEKAIE